MSVDVIPLPEAARKPEHPDHARWTFDALVKQDVDWRRKLGQDVSQRSSEETVAKRLVRLYARKRDQSTPIPTKPVEQNHEAAKALATKHGVEFFRGDEIPSVKDSGPIEERNPCRCMQCRDCRLKIRLRVFLEADPVSGDHMHREWAKKLEKLFLHAKFGTGPFRRIYAKDKKRRILRKELESLADQSTGKWGFWA
jgi:hypothetical protein